jgi:hypothetical protein
MPLDIGSTFINKSTPKAPSHLWIIISSPFGNPEKVIIVNLTTWRDQAVELNDGSCIVNSGEHGFVKTKSYIYYREAKDPLIENLQKAMQAGLITPHESCSTDLLCKILLGAEKSPFTPLKVLQVLKDQELT